FAKGNYDTHFIDEHEEKLFPKQEKLDIALIAGALSKQAGYTKSESDFQKASTMKSTPWQELGKWEICSLS
ncbi:MAG: hypothetical protein KAW88_09680, partial [Candidatus Cloacimonetes bacterium]|nr:hypothetical protein [Candidatus Cloacimonadota bacterium]